AAADPALVLKSEAPAGNSTIEMNGIEPEPFETFPINKGMFMNLPYGFDIGQVKAEQPVTHYDEFVDALIREIIHPLLVPFNYHAGSSGDSNMASASVDVDVYNRMQKSDRIDAEEDILDDDTWQWWQEGLLIPGYFGEGDLSAFRDALPDHVYRWDMTAREHSDPKKVADKIDTLSEDAHMLERDIQEQYFNRSYRDWLAAATQEAEDRAELAKIAGNVVGDNTGSQPSDDEDGAGQREPAEANA
ncbi:MAG: hypothetical protein KDA71_26760, partial [Planctomycetales bacterium]|nr:hypothetical protein [Planctomycetales bacterium]